jgi:hypothetical protein
MADHMKKAQETLKSVMHEFEPAKGHAVTGAREFLLALRGVVDAQINLLDRATTKKAKLPDDDSGDPKMND